MNNDGKMIFEAYAKRLSEAWNPMENLGPKADQIRNILLSAADDESNDENFVEAAKIVAGSPNDWAGEDYQQLVNALSFVFKKFVQTSMN